MINSMVPKLITISLMWYPYGGVAGSYADQIDHCRWVRTKYLFGAVH